MAHKNSMFNVELEEDNDYAAIWNTNSGAIIKLDKEVWDDLQCNNFDGVAKKYIEGLSEQGLIVPKDLDEVRCIFVGKKRAQYENYGTISLVIAPTLGCNFRCTYCFENTTSHMEHMSLEVQDQIVKYVKDMIASGTYHKLDISWFGGEPLLGYEDVIKPLSERFMALCKENDMKYSAGIVTNGYFLDLDVMKGLICDYKVTDFQITFDGTREAYCKAKRTNEKAYERVKDNMFELSRFVKENQLNIALNIRLNVDRNNYEDLKKFVAECQSDSRYCDNLDFYLGHLQGEGENFLSLAEFEALENDFEEVTHKSAHSVWTKKGIWCKQQNFNNFCVGPNGELYKCERHFGVKEKIVGNISYGYDYNDCFYSIMNVEVAEKCKSCELLPVCLGGCPHCAMNSKCGCDCISTIEYAKRLAKKQVNID